MATCRVLAANGAKVVVNGRGRAALQRIVEAIRAACGEATAVAANVAELDTLERLRERTERACGPAEVLGAFVGVGGPLPGLTTQITAHHSLQLSSRPSAPLSELGRACTSSMEVGAVQPLSAARWVSRLRIATGVRSVTRSGPGWSGGAL